MFPGVGLRMRKSIKFFLFFLFKSWKVFFIQWTTTFINTIESNQNKRERERNKLYTVTNFKIKYIEFKYKFWLLMAFLIESLLKLTGYS